MGLKINTPKGTKDIYGTACAKKSQVERDLMDIFLSYGYKRVETPTIESGQLLDKKHTSIPQNEVFRLFNNSGDVVALRADELNSVARYVSGIDNKEIVNRFSYIFNILRDKEKGLNEYTKAGAFVTGDDKPDIDAELIALAVKALKYSGLSNFKISIGFAGFSDNTDIRTLTGDEKILTKACELTKERKTVDAVKRLADIYRILGYYKVTDYVDFDFGIENKNNNYTGIIFIGHLEGRKQVLLKGGRFDNLIEKFGKADKSAGFSININRLLNVMEKERKSVNIKHEHVVIYTNNRRKDAIIIGEYFRYKDLNIELIKHDGCTSKKEYITKAYKKGALSVMFFDREKTVVADLVNSKITNIDLA